MLIRICTQRAIAGRAFRHGSVRWTHFPFHSRLSLPMISKDFPLNSPACRYPFPPIMLQRMLWDFLINFSRTKMEFSINLLKCGRKLQHSFYLKIMLLDMIWSINHPEEIFIKVLINSLHLEWTIINFYFLFIKKSQKQYEK